MLVDQAERTALPPWHQDGLVDESGGEDHWKMGATVEAHCDLVSGDGDVCRHVDQIAEDTAGLGIIVASHASGHQPVEGAGEDEERHVEINLEAD